MKITARYPWATYEIWKWIERIAQAKVAHFTITSLYRPRWYNTLVKGLWNSYHLKAQAADLALEGEFIEDLAVRARATAPFNGQVVIEKAKGIVHLEIED